MANADREHIFRFKQFDITNRISAMKVGTDGVLLGAWAEIADGVRRIADIGCGTGLIALMMAQRSPQAHVTAIEIDADAASEAKTNVAASPFAERVEVVNADATKYDCDDGKYDLVVSNPPFFTEDVRSGDSGRDKARREDTLTLQSLLLLGQRLLTSEGQMAIILPTARDNDMMFEATMAGLTPRRICHVVTSEGKAPKRTLWQLSVQGGQCTETTLIIRDASGNYNTRYLELVKTFYIKL